MFEGIKNVLRVAVFGILLLSLTIGVRIMGGKKALADVPSSSSSGDSSSGDSGGSGDGGGSGDS